MLMQFCVLESIMSYGHSKCVIEMMEFERSCFKERECKYLDFFDENQNYAPWK
jgi:hypothetical protein